MEKKIKRHLSLIMTFLMFFSAISGVIKPTTVFAAGNGTTDSPYSVSEALNYVQTKFASTNATGTVTVEGYIVGLYSTSTTAPKALAIADSPNTPVTPADKSKLIYVIPYTSATFTQNLDAISKWNTDDKVGRIVKVTGTWRKAVQAGYGTDKIATIGSVSSANLTITPGGPTVTLTGLTMSPTKDVYESATALLDLKCVPENSTEIDVTWKSSDTSAVTVAQDGTVKGVAAGKSAVITATSSVHPEISAQCTVSVMPQEPLIKINEARNKTVGTNVKVSGVVTYVDSTKKVYVQDDTAAIAVDANGYIGGTTPVAGDQITAMGELTSVGQLLTIKPVPSAGIVIDGKGTIPTPKVITVAKANSEEYESQLVKISGATLGPITSPITTLGDVTGSINIYKLPTLTGIVEGDYVDVTAIVSQFSSGASNEGYQLRVRNSADVVKNTSEDTIKPIITHTPITDGSIYKNLTISATARDDRKMSGVKLYYRENGQTQYECVDMPDSANNYVYTILKSKLNTKGLEYYLEAKDSFGNISTMPEDITKPYLVNISGVDIVGPSVLNLMPQADSNVGYNLRPTISAEYRDDSDIDPLSTKLFIDNVDVTAQALKLTLTTIQYTPSEDLIKGLHTVKLEVSDLKGNVTTRAWSFTVGDEAYNFYFGQLHSHTNISDGQGSLSDAYTWARDNGKADFFAVTDHSNSIENDTQCNLSDGSKSPEWIDAHNTADKFNEDGKFTAFYGFEMTWSGSTGGWGHINTFNTPGFETRNNTSMDLKNYYDTIAKQSQSISQLNHPGTTFGDFADFGYYTEAADKVVDLVEVGNGEGPVRSGGYFPSYEYYTRALDRGWHVAPTNNQDNHKGAWVTANSARTVILAPELTRDSLYDAMRAKRVYATEDSNLKLMFKVNGKVMGSTLDNPTSLNVSISINDPDSTDKVGKVSIIGNGGIVVQSKSFNSNNATWDLTLNPDFTYYYVRVDEEDKDIAVSAPVWTGSVSPVGISKVEVPQPLNIVNEPTNISAEIYNNGQFSLMNTKVEFFKNEINDSNKIGETVIPRVEGNGKGTATISWKPDKTGNTTIYARTSLMLGEDARTFTESTKMLVFNKEDISRVVIDAGHQNQYVSDTKYAGKYTTLQKMLAGKRTELVINRSAITEDVLKDAKALILTDPESITDTNNNSIASIYSDAEVAAIKKFVDAGGNLIITSRADRSDVDGEYGHAAQGNKILESIGTSLRFNDDTVIDNVEREADANYRLRFDDYSDSPKYNLNKDVPKDVKYSYYSGCSIILAPNGNDTNVEYLVKGHATTETTNSDSKTDNTPVTKGSVNALAAEILPGGGKLIVAGSTFFSDFEMTGDNQFTNVQITSNIMDWLAPLPQAELKSIKDFRIDANEDGIPDNLGKKFAIEGRVTAQSGAVLPSNAFFDCMYVQDDTAGITVFGVSQTAVKVGQKVRITGYVDEYLGDTEIQIADEKKDLQILDDSVEIVSPTFMSTGDSMLEKNEGTLTEIRGKVTKIDSQNIYVDDNIDDDIAPARAYVEGYIWDGANENNKGKWDPNIKVGDTVSVIGLASQDPEGHRLRVRNTSEIVRFDTTAPEITVKGVENGSTYTNPVTPVISVNEGSYTALLNGNPYDGSVISDNGDYVLEITAKDEAGNVSTKVISFAIDTLAPEIIILGAEDGGAYNSNVTISAMTIEKSTITVTLNDKVYEGTEISEEGNYKLEVIAKDMVGNETKKVINFTIDKTKPVITVDGVQEGKIYNTAVIPSISVNEGSYTALLNGKTYDGSTILADGEYKLEVVAKDKAENETKVVINFTIDKTAPVITITGVVDGKAYNSSVKPDISVNEGSFAALLNGKPYTGAEISVEGQYKLEVVAKDKAENETKKVINFTIDKTAPVITVTGVVDGKAYNTLVKPVISVNEGSYTALLNGKPYSGAEISLEGQYKLEIVAKDKAGNETKKVISFTIDKTLPVVGIAGVIDGKVYNTSIKPIITVNEGSYSALLNGKAYNGSEIVAAGQYKLEVTAKDKAGNISKKAVSFIIDKTAPVITITGVVDGKAYNTSVKPVISVNEGSFAVLLNGKTYDGKEITTAGQYKLEVTAKDKAGNITKKAISFTIDKTAPIITIAGAINGKVYNTSVKPVISVNEGSYSALLNGKLYNGSQIVAAGQYKLEVTAKDKAGNVSKKVISFVIDKTAPVITITGVSNGKVYNTSVKPVISVNEGSFTVLLNGKTYDGKAIYKEGQYKLEVIAKDKAGNVSKKAITFAIKKKVSGKKSISVESNKLTRVNYFAL